MSDADANHKTTPVTAALIPGSVTSLTGEELPPNARRAARAYRLSFSLLQNGIVVPVRFNYEHIRPSSTILTTICETNGENGDPIVGFNRTAIYNVVPGTGYFEIWLEINSGQPIWVRIDALVIR
ncbi:hypothetical protein [Nannocystis sp. SCPEA4]|uniref:hypothetical protein n=1 Tax=Nannocystis sp. SCPEA4 TaxID=2996787 RepID=UPI00226D464F|nr:hypothetical protein [Nannocystis sp. SCPEA4]MCY1054189.1 hypothetical protein [Nannocystis sp. SCPEA4]